jgi:2-(1,2-epoxy-1,2-dihydrophenyl)acetyl-CoA isomerase
MSIRTEMRETGVMLVTLDRPGRLNALTQAMKRDLIELMTAAQLDDAVRVVVFAGAGKAFCAGDDLRGYHDEAPATVPKLGGGHTTPLGTANALRVYSQGLNLAVRNLDKITIAAIDGPAIQTGLSLALSCDFRIAGPRAKLGSATLRFGLMPDEGGHWLLLQHLGLSGTLDFLLRKRIADADESQKLGLVNEVAPDAVARALDLARELAEGPQVAMRMLKRSVYNAAESSFALALDDIAARTAVTDHHADAREGAKSFTEKRQPRFNQWLEPKSG